MGFNNWDWAVPPGENSETSYLFDESLRCKDCVSWRGAGIKVGHSHCKDHRSPHQTTSKHGDEEYDRCVYFIPK